MKNIVVDTSVILESLYNIDLLLQEHNVFLTDIVLQELDGKKNDEKVGYNSREFYRILGHSTTLKLSKLPNSDIVAFNNDSIIQMAYKNKYIYMIVRNYYKLRDINETKIIENAQNERRKAKDEAAKKIKEFFGDKVKLSSRNITKYMLWEQQNGRCIYTGEVLNLEKLFEFEGGPYKIDYILPRSRSFDESFGNMVLTTLEAKLSKADKTPFEWFGKDEQKWQDYKAFCNSPATLAKLGKGKVNRLTKENFDENSSKEYMRRSIENDRMYAAKLVKEIFEKHMVLPESPNNKQQVYTRNSRLTSELKKQWVSYVKQEEYTGARANILNAIIIAFSGQNMVRKLAQYYKWIETKYEKDSKPSFEKPYPFFKDDLEKFLRLDRTAPDKNGVIRKRLLVAIAPNRTVTGETNGATVISPKVAKEGKGVPVRQGKAIATTGGDIARGDIYFQDGQNHLVVVYARDMGGKKIPNVSTRGIVMEPESFLFSLSNGDIVSIEDELFQVKSFNAKSGELIGTYIESNIDKSITITKRQLLKYTVSSLGFYNMISKEKLQNTINR